MSIGRRRPVQGALVFAVLDLAALGDALVGRPFRKTAFRHGMGPMERPPYRCTPHLRTVNRSSV